MNKEHKKGLVPKLRFSEFLDLGEWENERLEQLYSFKTTNTYSRDQLNYENGLVKNVHYGDIHTKFSTLFNIKKEIVPFINLSESLKNIKPECYCIEGDIIFANTSEDLEDIGKSIELVHLNNEKLLSGLHTLLARPKNNKFILGFAGYLFKSKRIRLQIQKESQGTKVLGISAGRLSKIEIAFPPDKKEQTQIADCLSSLDDLITAQIQKIAALKTHKKGLMQQLFPQEGETVPKLRFPEFEDEWEWKELNNLASKVNVKNKNFEVKVVLTNSASYGIVRQDSYFDREIVTQGNLTGYYVVDVDDFIYNPRISNNALVGSLKRNNLVKGVMSPLYTVFRFKQGNLSFFEQYFETIFWHGYMKNLANTGARHDRLNISNENFFNLPLPFPTLSEQQKIADCLSSLDELINTHIKKCDALKLHKKGLMQQLFPIIDDGANE